MTVPDTDRAARIAAIKARWERRTDEQWEPTAGRDPDDPLTIHDVRGCNIAFVVWPSDAAAIAAAPEDIQWLINEIDRLESGR